MPEPYYQDQTVTLWAGDCLDVLRTLPDASVDAVVTDPPYGLSNTDPAHVAETINRWVNGDRGYLPGGSGFMSAAWDAFVPPVAVWDECLRVLKPGGHALVFAGSRTVDLMTLGLRLAGFEVRDSIAWMYGSGFPKSLDVSKAIDKARTEDREPVDRVRAWLNEQRIAAGFSHDAVNKHFGHASNGGGSSSAWMTNPTSRSLPTWDQWQEFKQMFGFSDEMDAEVWRLNGRKGKPGDAYGEREVLSTRQVSDIRNGHGREYGGAMFAGEETGKIEHAKTAPATDAARTWQGWGTALKPAFEPIVVARKPLTGNVAANVLAHGTGALNVDGCRIGAPEDKRAAGTRRYIAGGKEPGAVGGALHPAHHDGLGRWPANVVLDEASARELDEQSGERPGFATQRDLKARTGTDGTTTYGKGVGALQPGTRQGFDDSGGASRFFYTPKAAADERVRVDLPCEVHGIRRCTICPPRSVAHPTVKPLALMRWLVRLVTPPGGTVLEPFAGSGTTVEACILEGFECVAIEREPDYLPLIMQRIHRRRDPVQAVKGAGGDGGLFDLLGGDDAA